jgi:hypothetical protein
MTESPSPAAGQLFAALAELRQATVAVSYAMLVRQAAAQQPSIQISSQRLSDWFGGNAVPTDPAVVRFVVEYLQPKVTRTSGYQRRPLSWWLDLHQNAVQQRQANRDGGHGAAIPQSRDRLGRPVDDCDPLRLEVHPAIHVPGEPMDPLPGYVLRAHDTRLREAVDQILPDGSSQLVTLVGRSSTGEDPRLLGTGPIPRAAAARPVVVVAPARPHPPKGGAGRPRPGRPRHDRVAQRGPVLSPADERGTR